MKPQDVILLCLLIANKESQNWKQYELASHMGRSVSTINKSLKRLERVKLILTGMIDVKYYPHMTNAREFLKTGVYWFYDHKDVLKAAKDIKYGWIDI